MMCYDKKLHSDESIYFLKIFFIKNYGKSVLLLRQSIFRGRINDEWFSKVFLIFVFLEK